jgi:ribose transport system substrate-binding protein
MASLWRSPRWGAVRLVLVALAAVLLAAAAAGCGGDDEGGGEAAATEEQAGEEQGGDVQRIAFFGFASANSFAQATWAGVQEVAKREGVEARFFDPNFDAQKQVSQIQDAIASGQYQAFVVQANDGNAVVPAVREAIDQGITVVGEFTPIGTKYDTIEPQVEGLIFVGEPPTENGEALAQMAIDACEGIDPCRVVYFEGFKALPLDNARTNAFKEKLATADNAQLVASVEGGYTQESGRRAAQDVLQAQQKIDVIVGSSQAIQGAEQAIADAGRQEEIKLIGNGGSKQAVSAVKEGRWFGTYVIAERSAGAKAAELAISAARGEDVPESFDTRELQEPVGTKDNLGDFEGQYSD